MHDLGYPVVHRRKVTLLWDSLNQHPETKTVLKVCGRITV